MNNELDGLARKLRGYGYKVIEPVPQPPCECSECGISDKEDYLVEFRVQIASGEEGYSDVTIYRCDLHSSELMEAIFEMGFLTHHHGTISYLEDTRCPGARRRDDCPTPTGHQVIITANGVWSEEE